MIATEPISGPSARGGRWLRAAAGTVFTSLIVFAPLNFASTRAGGSELLTVGCIMASLLWLLSLPGRGWKIQVPLAVLGGFALLIAAALPWITGYAHPTSVAAFTQTHFANVAARWPYSIVWRTPANTLAFTLTLAVSLLALVDLAHSRAWILTFSLTLAITGFTVAAIALLQNYTHATGIYWRNDGRMPGAFCGPFFHHTAAGAYFNTAWPFAFTLTWLAWERPHARRLPRILAVVGTLATIVMLAAHGSHVSRFPQVAALLVAPFLLRGLRIKIQGGRRWLFVLGGVAAITLLIFVAGRTATIGERWQLLFSPPPTEASRISPPESAWPALIRDDLLIPHTSQSGWFGDRGEGWRTALRSISQRPLTGHGPANWIGAASHNSSDPFVRTFFQFLQFTHQDVLQFAVEWGIPATLGWWGLLAGAVIMVVRARHWVSPLHRTLGIAAACGLAALLLQSQLDFPLQIPAIAFNAIVLAALCWAVGSRRPMPIPSEPPVA